MNILSCNKVSILSQSHKRNAASIPKAFAGEFTRWVDNIVRENDPQRSNLTAIPALSAICQLLVQSQSPQIAYQSEK